MELQRHLWSADARLNGVYLDWKYLSNPYIAGPLIYLAYDGDELVGMRGAFGSRWEAGRPAESFTLPYPDDLVVAPAHRGHWLQQKIMGFALADMAQRGYPCVVNLSASRETAVGSLRMKWRKAGGVHPMYRRTLRGRLVGGLAEQLARQRFLWRWADRVPTLFLPGAARSFARLDARFAATTRTPGTSALFLEHAPRVGEMAALVRRLPHDGRIRHVRDETFLAWRYGNPLHSYRFLYAGGERLEGYLVLQRLNRDSRRRVCIVDWEARDERLRAELLAAAVDGDFPEIYTWAAGLGAESEQALARSGFVPAGTEFETSILVRPTRDADLAGPWIMAGQRLDDAAAWDLRMVYSARG